MNILWDMRLYSTGYGNRGVGTYCTAVSRALLSSSHPDYSFFVWADPEQLPSHLRCADVTVIPCHGGNWKTTIAALPFIVLRHRIDLLHYWVALGPLPSIGIVPLLPVPSVATIHDLGVELWDTPHSTFMRMTPYWRLQRRFIRSVSGIITNSDATCRSACSSLRISGKPHTVAYPPFPPAESTNAASERKPYCITLTGGPHKNLKRIITAFKRVHESNQQLRLILLGAIDSSESVPMPLPEGITHEPSMERYEAHLRESSGMLFCSSEEGLGIPPVEAMRYGCPLLLSDIPPLRETCSSAARFTDPASVESIVEGINDLLADTKRWSEASFSGWNRYQTLSGETPQRIFHIYSQLLKKSSIPK